MSKVPKKYWDTSLFLCFLNDDEDERRRICEDNLKHAKNGKLIIFTSYWTVVEVIKPRKKSLGVPKLTPDQIKKIQGMFEWPWLKLIQVEERVAKKAVELSRQLSIHPTDSVHSASAIINNLDALQRWDRDFDKVAHLIKVEEPDYLTKDLPLFKAGNRIGPHPEEFDKREIKNEKKGERKPPKGKEEKSTEEKREVVTLSPKLR